MFGKPLAALAAMSLAALPLSALPGSWIFPARGSARSYGQSTSKYEPHQGAREKARRVRQMGRAGR